MNYFVKRYTSLSKPVKASLWFILSNVILKGISFFTLPIFSRLLTPEQYGVVSVYNSWVGTISIITTLTIWGGVFNVGMVKFEDDSKRMISSFQGLAIFITLIAFLLSVLFLGPVSSLFGMPKLLTVCMYLEILAQIPYNIWATEQRYKFEYKKLILVTFYIAILSPVLGVIAVSKTTYKAEARIISNLIVNLLLGILLFGINLFKGKTFFNKKYWLFGFKFNIVLVPHYLATQILNQADRIMINSMCGSNDAGIYSVAYNFALLLSLLTNGINSSLTPHIYQSLKENKTEKLKKETTLIVLFVAIMTIGMICAVPEVFKFMLPESYYGALRVIPPISVGAFFLFLYPLFGSIEFYYEENKYVTYASLGGAVLNVLLNYVFIKLFGFIAAAYTTLICYLLFSIGHYFFMKKVLKKNNKKNEIYDIRAICYISITLVISSMIMLYLYDYTFVRWGVIACILFVFILARKKLGAFFRLIK